MFTRSTTGARLLYEKNFQQKNKNDQENAKSTLLALHDHERCNISLRPWAGGSGPSLVDAPVYDGLEAPRRATAETAVPARIDVEIPLSKPTLDIFAAAAVTAHVVRLCLARSSGFRERGIARSRGHGTWHTANTAHPSGIKAGTRVGGRYTPKLIQPTNAPQASWNKTQHPFVRTVLESTAIFLGIRANADSSHPPCSS